MRMVEISFLIKQAIGLPFDSKRLAEDLLDLKVLLQSLWVELVQVTEEGLSLLTKQGKESTIDSESLSEVVAIFQVLR